jgi:hypothetical protein
MSVACQSLASAFSFPIRSFHIVMAQKALSRVRAGWAVLTSRFICLCGLNVSAIRQSSFVLTIGTNVWSYLMSNLKRAINISTRKVGGLRFVKLGRFTFMFCVSKEYKSL